MANQTGEDLVQAARHEIVPEMTEDEVPLEYKEFLKFVDEKSRMRFLHWLPREQKQQVMSRGSLNGAANPSATLEYRMEIAVGGPLIPPLEHFLRAHQLGDEISQQLRALPEQTQAAIIGRGSFRANETQQSKERILNYRIAAEKSKEAARFREEYRKLLQRAEEIGDIVFRDPRKRADSAFAKLPPPAQPKPVQATAKPLLPVATRILKDIVQPKESHSAVGGVGEKKPSDTTAPPPTAPKGQDTNNPPQLQKPTPQPQQKVDMAPIREINDLRKQQELAAKTAPVAPKAPVVPVAVASGSEPSEGLQLLIAKSRQQHPPSPAIKKPKEEEKKEPKIKRELIELEVEGLPPPDDINQQVKRPRPGPTVEALLVGVTSMIQRQLQSNLPFS